jgi:Flp pilus assembly protein TadD
MRQARLSVGIVVLACLSVPALPQGSSACVDTKDYYKAVAVCSDLIRARPKDAAAYHMRGVVLARNGDTGQAIADYTKAIALNPAFVPAYNSRALAYTSTGDYTRALAAATKASALEAKKGEPVRAALQANKERQAKARPASQTKRRASSSASLKRTEPEQAPLNPFQGM